MAGVRTGEEAVTRRPRFSSLPLTPAAIVGHRPTVIARHPADASRVTRSAENAAQTPHRRWKARALAFGPVAVAVAVLAQRAIAAVLAKIGHAGATLDDAYIHFQYARAIAEGHPLRFAAGEPIASGSTSLLWPVLLAPFWALGARDDAIVWVAWALSFTALGALAWEVAQLTDRLAGETAAIGAGAMTVAFGGFVWCAASGMEVVPFAWAIARASRRAADWAEASPEARTGRRAAELAVLAWVAVFFRPEGAVTALFVAATLAGFPRTGAWRERLFALAPAAAVMALPFLLWMLTGSPHSTTAVVKLLPGNPNYVGAALVAKVVEQAKLLLTTLLNGEALSVEFVPHGGAPVALAGLGAIAVAGVRTRSLWRAAAALLLALTMFAPCFYITFLWNRLRYLWPFATGWIVGLACLARLAGDAAGRLSARWRAVTGIGCGVFVGLFASKLDWVIDDVAQSASGIDRQQVALGRWARDHLPPDARIGVNDTGAIAYFSEHTTFDVVGLTTQSEARYWVAGVGSRLEHYERLHASAASRLPSHFIVYPEWMGLDAVLGAPLYEVTVTDSTILGGRTMRAYQADWSKLGTGEQPWSHVGTVLDAVDVADLESEAEHDYALMGAREGQQTAHEGVSPSGATVLDGGRTERTLERFVAHLPNGVAARGIVRLAGRQASAVSVLVNDEPVGEFEWSEEETEDWVERSFEIPPALASSRTRVELRVHGGPITVFHYWFAGGA
jgi:hypothetical protein